jgi:hypothetical protein
MGAVSTCSFRRIHLRAEASGLPFGFGRQRLHPRPPVIHHELQAAKHGLHGYNSDAGRTQPGNVAAGACPCPAIPSREVACHHYSVHRVTDLEKAWNHGGEFVGTHDAGPNLTRIFGDAHRLQHVIRDRFRRGQIPEVDAIGAEDAQLLVYFRAQCLLRGLARSSAQNNSLPDCFQRCAYGGEVALVSVKRERVEVINTKVDGAEHQRSTVNSGGHGERRNHYVRTSKRNRVVPPPRLTCNRRKCH